MDRRTFLGLLTASPLAAFPASAAAPSSAVPAAAPVAAKSRPSWPLMFEQAAVGPGLADIAVVPQMAFVGRQLLLSDQIADKFLLRGLRIGNVYRTLLSSDGVPGELFQHGEQERADLALPALAAQSITLVVENRTDVALPFAAALCGETWDRDDAAPNVLWPPPRGESCVLGVERRPSLVRRFGPARWYSSNIRVSHEMAWSEPDVPLRPSRLFVPRRALEHYDMIGVVVVQTQRSLALGVPPLPSWSMSPLRHRRSLAGHGWWDLQSTLPERVVRPGDMVGLAIQRKKTAPEDAPFVAAIVGECCPA